ncbi:hypothetical protein [Campylobacter cuniculorum]|uniref:Uncharacterized protein n=1 Tax=Campylobacter cuniculorum TaxID=374106 RepID=A0ABX6TYM6_9BACT|nr:hypothetical protein [Campylobacter cuniculorum]QOR04825.1 hypothetical protein A0071_02455 [Campylobacter cuniculorum]
MIEQIAHFENELKALWLKPKFAKNTQYVFSLDLLHSRDKTLLESLSKDKGFEAQIAERKELHLLYYRKSRKFIKILDKTGSIKLDMSGCREDFDIFVTLSNLMGLKIKRIFLEQGVESCEFDNGACVSLNNLDFRKFPKLKNLIWWE